MNTLDVTEAEFPSSVLALSQHVPVVVDFWAAWCAPCRALGPILEREVAALGGRVVLKKLDVDQAQGLSQHYGVQGIPAVMAFRGGEVVADFVGAKDAAFVRAWLAALAPSAALEQLKAATTEAELAKLLEDPEAGPGAALRLAQLKLQAGDFAGATALLPRVPPNHASFAKAQALGRLATLGQEGAAAGGEAAANARLALNEHDVGARYALACALAGRGDFGSALAAFLEVVRADRTFREDGARKAMLALFEELGAQHELTLAFRRKLMLAL